MRQNPLTREDLLDFRNDICPANGWMPDAIEQFHAVIDLALQALDRQWIPVTPEQPEPHQIVIVPGGCAYRRPNGTWVTMMDCPHRAIEWTVTHWQPLPTFDLTGCTVASTK